MLMSSWLSGRILDWRYSQTGFDPIFRNLACLAILMSSDRTKQSVCGWYLYIYELKKALRNEQEKEEETYKIRIGYQGIYIILIKE